MLDKFKTFIALAKYKSFTVTAQKLFCSQPTISQHIKVLEKEYHAQLIQRRNGEVLLTLKGQQFLHYVEGILALHNELSEKMIAATQTDDNISIYVSHYLATHFFNELFVPANDDTACPYRVQSQDYAGLKASLLEEKTNFAIMPYYAEDAELNERFKVEVLFEEEFVLIVPNEHPLAHRKVVYTKDLERENVFLPMSNLLQQRIRAAIEQKEVFPTFSHMSDFSLIQKAVHLQMGVGFVPKYAISESEKNFTVKTVKGLHITRQNAFIINRFKNLTAQEAHYLQFVKDNLATIGCV